MSSIEKNIKNFGILNIAWIIIAIILRLLFIRFLPLLIQTEAVASIISLIFGLVYAIKGYDKVSAKYYKAYMVIGFLCAFLSLISSIYTFIIEGISFSTVINIVCNCIYSYNFGLLTFAKDLGKERTVKATKPILINNTVKLVTSIFTKAELDYLSSGIANLTIALVTAGMVKAKYRDKELRGAK